MKRKPGSTTFLKAVIVLFGLAALALCVFVVPEIAGFAAELYPDMSYIQALVMIDLYGAALPFYIALYQAFKLLGYIDQNKAFSDTSVQVLKNIKNCAVAISGMFVIGMPLFYLMAERDDAPGIIVIGMIIILASMVIAVFAAVLQKLLNEAIELKSENDLTV
ncbi:DUF2975 domain-containing protein [Paenibacillus sp. LMG 31459]|jgi:hypothetical protein|uniref:DUF2975 domain-containing protein n=1 Tax=Paenibacillus phytohabitans TaxID=2654978 RepID=A0ABX1YJV3_9BACL|nr:DUF2975 domain-containing protein [Paenibacillus phytohabitans]NOU80406.1 DUF2975 domain-containing protein [Paenibacillus phytohabitans]